MTGEADWVAFLSVGLGLDRVCCAQAGSTRALVLPCEAWGADGACGGCPAGYVGQANDVVRQVSISTSKSQLMPRLLGRSCGR